MKRCNRCRKLLPLSEFHKAKSKKDGYAGICKKCRSVVCADWYSRNREREKPLRNKRYADNREYELSRNSRKVAKLKEIVLRHYGEECSCCREDLRELLTIDHIDGRGDVGQRDYIRSGHGLYRWLIKNGFPAGFQTLCYNCNIGKHKCGICPHQLRPVLVESAC